VEEIVIAAVAFREGLDRVTVFNELHLRRVLSSFSEPSFPEQGLSRATPCATFRPPARLSLFPKSAGCTPATNVAPLEV
jgi:hypothetical protein